MAVELEELRALLKVLSDADVAEFEHESEGVRVFIKRGTVVAPAQLAVAHAAPAVPSARGSQVHVDKAPVDDGTTIDVTSPFVGTFYRAPSPETPAFVEVGSQVKPGQTLCIVEAMKLMNEIEAELAGTIVEIYAQNGKAVEFGQKLFRLKKA
ncbi:MAG: acetyl-CoA carboxylase biotin carboxyl carrier protein [Myxococcales bacterium]|nr:acetyl-CoA carboxylase biotin carboxyl carrier protein [Myxococcales bacterium]